jgi:trimeric autotransporter adhesin
VNRDVPPVPPTERDLITSELEYPPAAARPISDELASRRTSSGRHSRSRHRKPGRRGGRSIAAVAAVLLGAVGAVSVVALGGPGNAQGTAEKLIAQDSMNRTVSSGFGSAAIGGAYIVAPVGDTKVVPGAAQITSLKPAGSATAYLPGAAASDTRLTATFALSALPDGGTGVYLSYALRRQAQGDRYYARVRVQSSGVVSLGFSRLQGGVETMLDNELALTKRAAAGQSWTVEATVTGTNPVRLQGRLWPTATAAPADWQQTTTDTSAGRVNSPGYIGLTAYLSGSAAAPLAIHLQSLAAYETVSGTEPPAPQPASQLPSPSATATSTAAITAPATAKPTATVTPSTTTATATATPTATPTATNSASAAPKPGNDDIVGSLPLGATNYPIPAGAKFVATTGKDSAAGTSAAPVATITRAIALAPSGATIVVRGGTYHERVNVPSGKALTIQSYPGEVVWIDGSSVVSGWQRSGSVWVHAGWTAAFDSTAGYTSGQAPTGENWSFVDPAFPLAAHPDQSWRDGVALSQVASAAKVTAGTFYIDHTNHQLVIGDDPTGRVIRSSDLSVGLSLAAANTTVRGIGIRRFATSIPAIGSVLLTAPNQTLENVIVSESGSAGIGVTSTKATLSHVTSQHNAMIGIQACYADGIAITDSLVRQNNTEHFNKAPVAGGLKITRTRGITISNSDFLNNEGTGIWLDESTYNAKVIGNRSMNNANHGLSLEISSTAVLANNVITGNSADGFKINDADHVKIWNNHIANNARNIELVQDARRGSNPSDPGHDPRQNQPDPTMPWLVSSVQVMNNVIGAAGPGNYSMYIRDYSGQYTAAQMKLTIDGNQLTKVGSPGAEVVWGTAGNPSVFSSVTAFTGATGQGPNNGETDASGKVTTVAKPQPLPADVAALVGQATGIGKLGVF